MIVCNVFACFAALIQVQTMFSMPPVLVTFVVMGIVIFPVAGIVADTCIGRFKMIRAGIFFLMLSSYLNILSLLLQKHLPNGVETILVICMTGLCCIGASCKVVCIFPFLADQLIGASAEQLSFAIYWIMWGLIITSYISLLNKFTEYSIHIALEAASFLCISVIPFIFIYCKNLLTILPQPFNPYKLIFKVLNYARLHKYPERRSALTYWEEDIPSRIDLGKSKYGGPFTVEEVEDVKTFLRLLPIIICAGGCVTGSPDHWKNLSFDMGGLFKNFESELAYSYLVELMMIALGFPFYHFFLYPLFYNYIPTMFNRIKVGLVLLICSNCLCAIVGELLICNSEANTTCLLFRSELFNISSTSVWWITAPRVIHNAGFFLSAITLFEFVCAQSPRPLCGLLVGLTIMAAMLSLFINFVTVEVVHIFSNDHCRFYSNLSIVVITIVYLIFFHFISKRYKLRKRDDIVPIHLFAEEYFEKEIRGRKRLEKETFSCDKKNKISL